MTPDPAVIFGLAGIEVVEHDMDRRVGVVGDDVVHEVDEFDAPPARLVSGRHLADGDLKQGRGAVLLVVVAMAGQRPALGELQTALRTLQRLDRGLFIVSSTQMTIAFSGGAM